jgi:solute carrier family 25 protein 33/36
MRRRHRGYRHRLGNESDLQLSTSERPAVGLPTATTSSPGSGSIFGGSVATMRQIAREEGIRGFYKGLSASYLGVTEGTIQWVLYERLKRLTASTNGTGGLQKWAGMLGSAEDGQVRRTPHRLSRLSP